MELKQRRENFVYVDIDSLNRTFMELKRQLMLSSFCVLVVLIEPLWNWNLIGMDYVTDAQRLNRTFMELKREKLTATERQMQVLIEPLWNWNMIVADITFTNPVS